jgi:hypothetical protein
MHIGHHGRLEESAAERVSLSAADDLGAFLHRIGDMCLDLLDRLHVDQRPDDRAWLEPVCDLHRTGGLGETLGEGVVDAVLHQDAVGADAGLPGISIFRGDRTPCLRRGKLLTAISMSASSKKMNGALPPSSSESFLTAPSPCCISNLPTSVEPCGRSGSRSARGRTSMGSILRSSTALRLSRRNDPNA